MTVNEQNEYIDARELIPDYVRYECKHCGHGWILDSKEKPNFGKCAKCRVTQDNEYMAETYGVKKIYEGLETKYVEVL